MRIPGKLNAIPSVASGLSPTFMTLSPDFTEALAFATSLHNSQLRKGTQIPYMAHLLAVAGLVLEYGGTEDEAIAALLHDAVEDQGGRAALAAGIVESCSDTDVEPKPEWRERKERYLLHLAQASPSVLLVSAADKLHNATAILRDYRNLGDAIWGRFKGGSTGTLWNYRALVQTYLAVGNPSIVQDLNRVVTELEDAVASSTSLPVADNSNDSVVSLR